MKLPFAFPFGKQEKKEYFLALLLREEKVSAVIFEEFAGKIRVVGEHEKRFKTSIEHISAEEFLEILDETISTSENNLPNNIETQKTIFGVKENWVEGTKIKKDYLLRLKKASDTLGLSPIGFLIIQEAIAHLMQKEEGAPVSAILLEVGKYNLAISLLRAGRVLETKRTKLEDSIPKTTDRMLHHFTEHEVLPSRIVIFDDGRPEELSQSFIAHTWTKSLPFLHVPQITVLPKGFDAKAILFGAAIQMGFEILGNVGEETRIKERTTPQDSEQEPKNKTQETTTNDTFGFVKEKDIASLEKEPKSIQKQNIISESKDSKTKKIAIDKPEGQKDYVDQKTTLEGEIETEFTENNVLQEEPLIKKATNPSDALLNKGKMLVKTNLNNILRMALFFHKGRFLSKSSHIQVMPKNNKFLFIAPAIFLLSVFIVLLYIFYLKAEVTLSFAPKSLEEKQTIIFSVNSPTDFEKHLINVKVVSIEEEGVISMEASGKKEIGEKAKGSVTIFNSSLSEEKNFPKGTILISTNNLEFATETTVSVASASGDASAIQSSNVKVNVTAKDIGKEYNLPSGTKFSVSSLPSTTVIAKNDTAFSGGSRKEITVVAKADVQKVNEQLPKSLEKKANENIAKKIAPEDSILPIFINAEIIKQELDKDIGEEANELNLKGVVSYESVAYAKSELAKYTQKVLAAKQQDMVFSENGINYSIENIKKKNDKEINAVLNIKADLIPKIDKKKLADSIAGKSFADAEISLLKLPQASDVRVSLIPNIPFLPQLLPKIPKNITFAVQTHE